MSYELAYINRIVQELSVIETHPPVLHAGSDRNGLEEETSSSATGNPFGDSDIPDTHLSRRLADDGNYSDCDNESDEEEESDHETDSPRNDEKELISTTKPRLVAGAGTVEQEEVSSRNSVKKKLIRTFLG